MKKKQLLQGISWALGVELAIFLFLHIVFPKYPEIGPLHFIDVMALYFLGPIFIVFDLLLLGLGILSIKQSWRAWQWWALSGFTTATIFIVVIAGMKLLNS